MQAARSPAIRPPAAAASVYVYRTGSVCQLYSGKSRITKPAAMAAHFLYQPQQRWPAEVRKQPSCRTIGFRQGQQYLPSAKTLTIPRSVCPKARPSASPPRIPAAPVAFSNDYKKDYANYFSRMTPMPTWSYKDDQKLYLVSGAVARPLTVTFGQRRYAGRSGQNQVFVYR